MALVISRRGNNPEFPANTFSSSTWRRTVSVPLGASEGPTDSSVPWSAMVAAESWIPATQLGCWCLQECLDVIPVAGHSHEFKNPVDLHSTLNTLFKLRRGGKKTPHLFIAALYPLGISFTICAAVGFKFPKCFGSCSKVCTRAAVSCPIKFKPKIPLGNGLGNFWDSFNPC